MTVKNLEFDISQLMPKISPNNKKTFCNCPTWRRIMRIFTLFFIITISSQSQASANQTNKQEMKEMKRIHSQCMNSHKSPANCHKDIMKACDASQDDCLRMLERMNMKEVLKSQEGSKAKK